MLRAEITGKGLHGRQADRLTGRVDLATAFGPNARKLAQFRCTRLVLW